MSDKILAYFLMHGITASDVILNTMMALLGVAIGWSLIKLHSSNGIYQKFNLVHLIVNKEGYPDGAKCIEMATFVLLSWGFIVQVTTKTLTEWYVQIFVVAFVLRGGYGAYLRATKGTDPVPPPPAPKPPAVPPPGAGDPNFAPPSRQQ